jgi:hypothetical protein
MAHRAKEPAQSRAHIDVVIDDGEGHGAVESTIDRAPRSLSRIKLWRRSRFDGPAFDYRSKQTGDPVMKRLLAMVVLVLSSAPAGGVMMGMYRLVIDGKPSFYEFLHLAEDQGSLVLKLNCSSMA